jgi:carbonic anhydrase
MNRLESFLITASIAFLTPAVTASTGGASGDADRLLQQLLAGNRRYVAARALRPHQAQERRLAVAKGQRPFAIVLGCSDSRVPIEIIFDQGIGDLFVIRVAGNIVDDAVLGSIEYAVEHFGVPLIIVLGHQRCGAVEAALQGGKGPGHIGRLIQAIAPAVNGIKGDQGAALDRAVRANIRWVVQQLKSSAPILAGHVREGKLKVIGARYDLESGRVEVTEPSRSSLPAPRGRLSCTQ